MPIQRAERRFAAPRQAPPQVGSEGRSISAALGEVKRGANIVKQKAEEAIQKREIADDNAAFMDAEMRYVERLAEVERELQKETPESGDGYAKTLKDKRAKVRDEILKGVPDYVTETGRERIGMRFEQLDSSSRISAAQWQDQRATNFAVSTFEKSVGIAAAEVMASPESAKQVLARTKGQLSAIKGRLLPEQETALARGVEVQLAEAAVTGLSERGDYASARSVITDMAASLDTGQQKQLESVIARAETVAKGEAAETRALNIMQGTLTRESLDEMHKAGALDDGEYAADLARVDMVERRKEAERDAKMTEARAANFARMQVGIDDGMMTRADADRAYKAGEINPSQWSQLSRQANNRKESADLAGAFAASLANGFPIDPMSNDAKKGADALFKQNGGADLFKQSFSEGMNKTGQFASAGIIPETARTILRGMKASGTPEQQMAAIEGISDLYTDYPNATDAAFSASEVAEAISFRDKLDAGIDPQVAYDAILVEREARNEPAGAQSLTKARVSEARKLSKDLKFKGALKEADTGRFTFDAYSGGELAKSQITADYQNAFQSYYVQHGDEELAKKQAQAVIGRTVGKSKVNYGRIMMHPPERYYQGVEPEYLQDALLAGVSEAMGADVKAKEIELISDGVTARMVRDGERPSYAVKVGNNIMPARWTFDAEAAEAMAKQKQDMQRAEALGEARETTARKAERDVAWSTIPRNSITWANMTDVQRREHEKGERQAQERAKSMRGKADAFSMRGGE